MIDSSLTSSAGRAGIYIVLSVHCKGYEAALGVKHSCFSGLYPVLFSLFFCLRREDTRRKIAGETHSLNWYTAWQRRLLQQFHAIVKCLRHSIWKKSFNDREWTIKRKLVNLRGRQWADVTTTPLWCQALRITFKPCSNTTLASCKLLYQLQVWWKYYYQYDASCVSTDLAKCNRWRLEVMMFVLYCMTHLWQFDNSVYTGARLPTVPE